MPVTGDAAQPIVYVNGKRHELPPGKAETTLLQYLRGALPPNLLPVEPVCPDLIKLSTVDLASGTLADRI